jgi:branched-chain amino acid transport system permease protein
MTDASILAQLTVSGLLLGGIYALAALGFSLIFGVIGVLNISHGDFIMLGGLGAFWLFTLLGFNPLLSLIVLAPVFFAVGFLFERSLIRPVIRKSPTELLIASILVTFGASLIIEDLTAFTWGAYSKGVSFFLPSLSVLGVEIPSVRLLFLIIVVAITAVLVTFTRRSYVGKAIRAITQDREAAEMMGINLPRVSQLTFGIGTALAALAGVLFVSITTITPYMGIPITIKLLAIIVLGGIASLAGPLIGGLVLGLAEILTAAFVGPEWAPAVALAILIAILLVKPEGLLGS